MRPKLKSGYNLLIIEKCCLSGHRCVLGLVDYEFSLGHTDNLYHIRGTPWEDDYVNSKSKLKGEECFRKYLSQKKT